MPILAVLVIFALTWWAFGRSDHAKPYDSSDEWNRAVETSVGLEKLFLRASRPLANVPTIYERSVSPQYQSLQKRLLAAGDRFGGSVEVFLAYQVSAIAAALLIVAVLATSQPDMIGLLTGLLLAFALVGMPYNQLNKEAKRRIEEINDTLPAFADLLQMPLTAGTGILPAMQFTVERSPDGVTKREVEHMLALQRTRAISETDAFLLAGERLGTAEAKSFFTALMQSHTQGTALGENLSKQSEALRDKAYEQRITKINKLETKVSMIVALHLIPMVMVIAMWPMAYSLMNI